ncbi:hypothetical protein NDU88_001355 [Pleurodeles waltl]|uniref:Nuclease HARBI1 n=1 Tax=Pleurodeles waltl TaxID=8319 RepID=A0AAV7UT42_PLEWA|nr:hypothetical protein NDU88_001355 [Pleurodeles waltl]
MLNCAAVFDLLLRRCTTPEQLPHFPLSLLTGSSLYYSPKKVCQIIMACCMLHNLALRRQVPFLQEDGPDDGIVAAVEPVDSEEDEAEEEDIDNRNNIIMQYFH